MMRNAPTLLGGSVFCSLSPPVAKLNNIPTFAV